MIICKLENTPIASLRTVKNAIISLLDYYNNFGQRYELYIPLIGTTSSRAKLSNKDSFELILNTIIENEKLLNGTINIVVYIKNKDEMEEYLDAI